MAQTIIPNGTENQLANIVTVGDIAWDTTAKALRVGTGDGSVMIPNIDDPSLSAVKMAAEALGDVAGNIGNGQGVVVFRDGNFEAEDRDNFRGAVGPANSTYDTLADIAAAPITNLSAIYAPESGSDRTTYTWTLGNFTGRSSAIESTWTDPSTGSIVPISQGAWLPPEAAAIDYGRDVQISLPLDKSLPRTLAYMAGVVPDSMFTQQPKLERAFADAANDGLKLQADPTAIYRKDGPLFVNTSFDGQGCQFIGMSDGPQVIRCLPDPGQTLRDIVYRNFKLYCASTLRTTDDANNGVCMGAAERPPILGAWLENVEVDGVDQNRGAGTAGFLFANVQKLRAWGLISRLSRADGVTMIHGCKDVALYRPIVEYSGDDAISSVAYAQYASQGLINENIRVYDAISKYSGARGMSVVGGRDIVFENPSVFRSAGPAASIVSEDSFDTIGNEQVIMNNVRAVQCVQGGGATGGPEYRSGIFIMTGRPGLDTIGDEPFLRQTVDCSINGIIRGAGPRASQAVSVDNQYVIRPRMAVDMQDIPSGVPGALIGGVDGDWQLSGRNIGSNPIVLSGSARGRHLIHDGKFDDTAISGAPAQQLILAFSTPELTELRIERMESNNGPNSVMNNDGFDMDRLRYRALKLNGSERGKDYQNKVLNALSGWTSSGGGLSMQVYSNGNVGIEIEVNGSGGAITNLPDPYRPKSVLTFSAMSNNKLIAAAINTAGDVVLLETPTAPGVYISYIFRVKP